MMASSKTSAVSLRSGTSVVFRPWRSLTTAALLTAPFLSAVAQINEGQDPSPPPSPSRVNMLLNFEFADAYLTPRGMIVQDDGLTFQPLLLGFVNVFKSDGFVNDVTLVGGVWNDFATEPVSTQAPFGSEPKTHWVEIDAIAGVSLTVMKQLKVDLTYNVFNMQILDIPTSQNLEVKLTLDDSPWLKQFSLRPYFMFWAELSEKATAARVPYNVFLGEAGPGEGIYFELGVTPGYTFSKYQVRVEAPLRVLLPDSNFYGEYYGPSSTVGLYELGLKGSVPLKFIAPGYGNWNFHVGFRFQDFIDENLQGMQQFNAPGKSISNITQVYGGIGIFF